MSQLMKKGWIMEAGCKEKYQPRIRLNMSDDCAATASSTFVYAACAET